MAQRLEITQRQGRGQFTICYFAGMIEPSEIAVQRLVNQQLVESACTSVEQVVHWMGAMQAQDYDMAKWAVGIRLPGSTESLIEDALDQGTIIRTHLLRPTWHLVAAVDIYWLLDLTAPHINRLIAGANRKLELDEAIFKKSNTIIENALTGNSYLTREELMNRLQLAGIRTDDIRSAHLMYNAELSGLVCNGPRRGFDRRGFDRREVDRRGNERRGKQLTYALLEERVPVCHRLSREEALAELAKRYFTSHGPATLKDFCWWSGLTGKDAKLGIALAQPPLASISVGAHRYWLAETVAQVHPFAEQIHFLPAFDEFTVSYCERSASLNPEIARQVITSNGIFKPIIVVDGQVVGLWKRTIKPKNVVVELTFFYSLPSDLVDRIHEKANLYARYTEQELLLAS